MEITLNQNDKITSRHSLIHFDLRVIEVCAHHVNWSCAIVVCEHFAPLNSQKYPINSVDAWRLVAAFQTSVPFKSKNPLAKSHDILAHIIYSLLGNELYTNEPLDELECQQSLFSCRCLIISISIFKTQAIKLTYKRIRTIERERSPIIISNLIAFKNEII